MIQTCLVGGSEARSSNSSRNKSTEQNRSMSAHITSAGVGTGTGAVATVRGSTKSKDIGTLASNAVSSSVAKSMSALLIRLLMVDRSGAVLTKRILNSS